MGILLLVKIGWRNLWRNPRGTLLTALALGLGLTLLLVSLGLLDGSQQQMVANAVRFGTGDVVIQAQGAPLWSCCCRPGSCPIPRSICIPRS